ncbi:hypothetical protein [Haliea sp. E17]|uniref:hypothetical protein n=1 Tax=Haliea sp. E17 TaxID=3401576 RepID=UPI003AAAA488
MRSRLRILALAGIFAIPVSAGTLDTTQLGDLQLEYARVTARAGYAGAPLAARVGFRPGDAISLVSEYRIQQVRYQVNPGDRVEAGQTIAELAGPEIHHFITAYAVTGERYETARKRFESNRELYRRKAIDENRWVEIADAYYSLQLEYEHMSHFRELLREDSADPDRILFTAPAAGRVIYDRSAPGIDEGGELAQVVPDDALRLQVAIAISQVPAPASLQAGECELALEAIGGVAEGFYRRAWSAPLTADCNWLPGEEVMVTPYYQRTSYAIPREALLHLEGQPAVFLRTGNSLDVVPVEVLGYSGGDYIVACDAPLAEREVLASSVSAVQGILLGLGGE